tara:strand:+ start:311 stop:673 length:363 start_codon:yes stop_codon:yes gene_type:complete
MKNLVALAFFLLIATPALADYLMAQPSSDFVPVAVAQTQVPVQSGDPTQKAIDILLSQGVAGIGLIVLAWWIKTTTAQARADRLRIEERVFDLMEKTNSHLAEQHAELENISREFERSRG